VILQVLLNRVGSEPERLLLIIHDLLQLLEDYGPERQTAVSKQIWEIFEKLGQAGGETSDLFVVLLW
jgi:hypothetical protein